MNKRILIVIPSISNDGPTNQTCYLISGLLEFGYRFHVVTVSRKNKFSSEHYEFLLSKGVLITFLDYSFSGLISGRKLLKEFDPCCLHSTLPAADLFSFLISFGRNSVITHRTDPEDHLASKGLFGYLLFLFNKYLFRRPVSVACSYSIASRMIKNSIRCDQVIRNCIPPGFTCLDREAFFRNSISFNFVVIGSLCVRKNPLKSLGIVSEFAKMVDKPVTLVFLGDGPLKAMLRSASHDVNLKVVLPGIVTDVNRYLENAHAHISSSSAEGLPNSVLESLALGVPNFLSDIPEHLEITKDSAIVNFFELNGDVTLAAEGLFKFIEHYQFSMFPFERFSDSFSVVKTADSYHKLYAKFSADQFVR